MTDQRVKMPVLFVGHGSPLNAIEDNSFTRNWTEIAGRIPKPEAILSISAHWYTEGTRIQDTKYPKMVYDMYGFPDELYRVEYKAEGSPEMARLTMSLITRTVTADNNWGYDHGTWSVLKKMYPQSDIPVFQLSVDSLAGAEIHFQLGQQLNTLRDQGVLIFGSGNVVHNLAMVNWDMEGGYPWAVDFDDYIKENVIQQKYQDVVAYHKAGKSAETAFTTPDHFYPLLYILGASGEDDQITVFNDACTMGSLSMTGYLFE